MDADAAYIAFGFNEVFAENVTRWGSMKITLKDPSILYKKAKGYWLYGKGYTIRKVKPGLYAMPAPHHITRGYNTTIIRAWQLPQPIDTVFRVNPGEIVYIGDFTVNYSYKQNMSVEVDYHFNECMEELIKQTPRLEGYVWIPSIFGRSLFPEDTE